MDFQWKLKLQQLLQVCHLPRMLLRKNASAKVNKSTAETPNNTT